MAEQLPIISGTRAVNATATTSTSLIGRGLSAILRKETGLAQTELDARYRQARDIYNRITHYGDENRFDPDLLPIKEALIENPRLMQLQPFFAILQQLADVFIVFQQLADQGYGKAYFPLANMYQGGNGMYTGSQGIRLNREKSDYYIFLAFNWCCSNSWHSTQALSDPEIWCDLGCLYRNGFCETQGNFEQDDCEAFICYEKAADQSYAKGQYYLGKMYADGIHVGQCGRKAEYWYRKAAEQGDADAQNGLGWIYNNGHGVKHDYDQAVFWFRKAAEQGHARAQCNLGWMYDLSHGVEQNDKQSVFWWRKAAEQGYAEAQYLLGYMYDEGQGVTQDKEQAVFWYRKAAEQNDEAAQKTLTNRGINWKDA